MTQGPKGGQQSLTWGGYSFPRGIQRILESSRHTTGVYGATLSLEPIPPMYIFDSHAEKDKNFTINPNWCKGLPRVKGKWGLAMETVVGLFVSVRCKGSMDSSLW